MQAAISVYSVDFLIDETEMHNTNNVQLVCVDTRNSEVWIFQSWPTLFQFFYRTNQLFNIIKGSTNTSSKIETVDALKQRSENASVQLSSAIHFSNFNVFPDQFLNSLLIFLIKAHQTTDQTWITSCCGAISGMKIEKGLASRNHKSRAMKTPAPVKTLHIDIVL